MIFQNDFGSSKEVASTRESESKPFLEKPEPCQRGPKSVFGLAFGFGFCPLKAKSQTKWLNLESNFF
jgi:hypothetical protein